jgi:hypothetical protein
VNVAAIRGRTNVTPGVSESFLCWLSLVGAALPPRDPDDDEDEEEDDADEEDDREPAVIREPDED